MFLMGTSQHPGWCTQVIPLQMNSSIPPSHMHQKFHSTLTLPETNSSPLPPENGRLEYDCFLLGWSIFRCLMAVSFREVCFVSSSLRWIWAIADKHLTFNETKVPSLTYFTEKTGSWRSVLGRKQHRLTGTLGRNKQNEGMHPCSNRRV